MPLGLARYGLRALNRRQQMMTVSCGVVGLAHRTTENRLPSHNQFAKNVRGREIQVKVDAKLRVRAGELVLVPGGVAAREA